MSELALLRWIQGRTGQRGGRIVVDSGDDCAVVRIGGRPVLFKVDSVIAKVHFTIDTPLRLVGRKAMARPLSDIAAMGGIPSFAVVALLLNRENTMADARALTRGLESLGVPIVGGDVKSHAGALALTVSVLGEMRGPKPVLRRGARRGDTLMVTGPLGASIRGHHLRFEPRLRLGRLFATRFRVHAMIDISDGLVRDLRHLHVAGADLYAEAIPRRGSLEQALHDGEDYELLVPAPPAVARRIERHRLAVPIGFVSDRPGVRLHAEDGGTTRLSTHGYEHRFGDKVSRKPTRAR